MAVGAGPLVLDLPEGKLTNLTVPRGFGGVPPEPRKFTMFTVLRARARGLVVKDG